MPGKHVSSLVGLFHVVPPTVGKVPFRPSKWISSFSVDGPFVSHPSRVIGRCLGDLGGRCGGPGEQRLGDLEVQRGPPEHGKSGAYTYRCMYIYIYTHILSLPKKNTYLHIRVRVRA